MGGGENRLGLLSVWWRGEKEEKPPPPSREAQFRNSGRGDRVSVVAVDKPLSGRYSPPSLSKKPYGLSLHCPCVCSFQCSSDARGVMVSAHARPGPGPYLPTSSERAVLLWFPTLTFQRLWGPFVVSSVDSRDCRLYIHVTAAATTAATTAIIIVKKKKE